MGTPRMECEGCERADSINDVTDLPPLYCPYCGSRRHVHIDPENPDNAKSGKV